MKLQDKLNEIKKELKEEAIKIVNGAFDDAYSELLPHIEDDHMCNVSYQSEYAVKNLLSGNFTITDKNKVVIQGDNNIDITVRITADEYDKIRKTLIDAMPKCPKDLEIESLKKQIEVLQKLFLRNL